jgi:hypothetical protein
MISAGFGHDAATWADRVELPGVRVGSRMAANAQRDRVVIFRYIIKTTLAG